MKKKPRIRVTLAAIRRARSRSPIRIPRASVRMGGYLSLSEALSGSRTGTKRLISVMCGGWCKPMRRVYFCPTKRAEEVAIRCEWCLKIFCRKCARRHFKDSVSRLGRRTRG